MDFVWNRVLADQVREATARVMTLQAEDMEKSAEQLLTAANRIDADIRAMEIEMRNATSDSARERVNERISEASARAAALRARARELNREAYELDRARRRTNELHGEMARMARETDGRYAARIHAIQEDIGRYLHRILELKDSMGIVSSSGRAYTCVGQLLLNPTFAPQWTWVNETLSRPADRITQKQYATLAWFYSMQTTLAGQEKFINMFLEPVVLPLNVSHTRNTRPFTICPQKTSNVQRFVDGGIGILFHLQTGLPSTSSDYNAIRTERDRLKGLSALLSVASNLTDHGVEIRTIYGPTGVQQRLVLGTEASPYVRLAENVSGGITISFARGEVRGEDSNHLFYRTYLRQRDASINISPVVSGAGMGRGNIIAATDYFDLRYQFDLAAYLGEGVMNLVLSAATWGAADALTLGLDAVRLFVEMPSAMAEAQGIQSDFRSLGNQALIGNFHEHFGLRGVVVTETGQTPQMFGWPTVSTTNALNALNSVFSEANRQGGLARITRPNVAIPQTSFTWQQFLENPTVVFMAYAALNEVGVYRLRTKTAAHHDARNKELREQVAP